MSTLTSQVEGTNPAVRGALNLLHVVTLTRVRFTLEPLAPFRLPDWPGSMYRGALGHALAALDGGSYVRLFREPDAPMAPDRAPPDAPRPYFVEWPVAPARIVRPGETHQVDVVFVGSASEAVPSVVAGMELAARAGLGTARVPHRLLETRMTLGAHGPVALAAMPDPLPKAPLGSLTLLLTTPLLLSKDHPRKQQFDADRLLRLAVERARSLARIYCGSPPCQDPLPRGCIEADASALRWLRTERESARQSSRIPLGGFVGRVELRGDLEPWREALLLALYLHAGRHASVGGGRVQLSAGRPHGVLLANTQRVCSNLES